VSDDVGAPRYVDGVLIVVPSRRAGAGLADPLLQPRAGLASAAAWTDHIVTLRDLVEAAGDAHPSPRPRLGAVAAALLATEVVDDLEPEVRALFGPGLEGAGASRAIGAALAEIRMAGLTAADVAQVAPGKRRLQALAAVLDLWERRVASGGWWDDAGAHRAALDSIESGAWPAGTLDRLEVHGIYDVTPLQGRLLLALARRAAEVRVHIPFDPDDEESTRFAFPYVHLWESLDLPAGDPGIVFPARRSPQTVTIAAGADRGDEVRGVADWLRSLGESGEPFEDVGVVLAEGARAVEPLARELDRRGVPWNARRTVALEQTPAFAAALLPFRFLEEGFRREDLQAWVTTPLTAALDADLLRPAVAAGPAGRARLAQWKRALAGAHGEAAARLVRALAEIESLGLEPRSPEKFWGTWADVLALAGLDPGEAWDEIQVELQDGLESVGRWSTEPQPWRTHRRQLTALLGDRRAGAGRTGRGVQVLTPYDARGLSFRRLAVVGLAQGALVARSSSLSVFGERERRALGARFGTELFRLPGEAAAEAELLIHEWLRTTETEMRLSWPGREDDGAPLLPGLELERVRRRLGAERPDTARAGELPAWRREVAADEVTRLQEVEAGRAAYFGRRPDERRGQGARYDGIFSGAALDLLASDVRERAHAKWSAGRLEAYRACPHRFFQKYILGLDPRDESLLEARPTAVGNVVHRALEILFEEGVGVEPPPKARVDAALAAAQSAAEPDERGDPDVWRALLARAGAFMDRYFRSTLPPAGDDPFRPERFEARFGLDPEGVPGAKVETSMGAITLRGRIDRLDRDPATNRLRVVDYKYSVTQYQRDAVRPELCGVDRFQLWVYYLGAREWARHEGWGEPPAVLGEIHCIRDHRKATLTAPPSPEAGEVERAIAAVVETALAGRYDPSPLSTDTCKYCDFKRSCRIATVSLGAPAGPAEDEP